MKRDLLCFPTLQACGITCKASRQPPGCPSLSKPGMAWPKNQNIRVWDALWPSVAYCGLFLLPIIYLDIEAIEKICLKNISRAKTSGLRYLSQCTEKTLILCWFVLLGVAGQIETAAETSVISFLLFLIFPYLIFPCFPFHFPCIQDISRPGPCKISARRALLSSFPHTRHFILQDKQWIGFNPGTSDPPKPHTKNLYNTCMIVYNHVMYGHTKESLCASIACKFAPVAALW